MFRRLTASTAAAVSLGAALAVSVLAQGDPPRATPDRTPASRVAKETFEVALAPQALADTTAPGTLGRKGAFVLQHAGTLSRGQQQLSITVVPDSGTDELAGLAGTMKSLIADGSHSYEFEYTLPDTP
jgi:hypothetical protein